MAPTPEEILRTAKPFSALPDDDRRHLAEVAEVKSFAAGELMLREADPAEYFYTILLPLAAGLRRFLHADLS